jgi:hypothetical protein
MTKTLSICAALVLLAGCDPRCAILKSDVREWRHQAFMTGGSDDNRANHEEAKRIRDEYERRYFEQCGVESAKVEQ